MTLKRAHEHLHTIKQTIEQLRATAYHSELIEVLEFTTTKLLEDVVADRSLEEYEPEGDFYHIHWVDGRFSMLALSLEEAFRHWHSVYEMPDCGEIEVRVNYEKWCKYSYENGQLILDKTS